MAFIETKTARFRYELTGPSNVPVLVFSNSLGTDLRMWDGQVDTFKQRFQVLRYDARGQRDSSITAGPYSIELLAQDVIDLLDGLQIQKASFCGLSMGGMVGMMLAQKFPQRLHKIVLCNTSPKIGTLESWNARIETVNAGGMQAVADGILERWFTPTFRATRRAEVEVTRQMLLESPPKGYVACSAAVRDMDQRETIASIRVPALVISGASDPVTPPADGRFVASQIDGARYVELPAAHLSNVEAAEAFNEAIERFLRA
jgi:3-oxoadipate enol-lactonase